MKKRFFKIAAALVLLTIVAGAGLQLWRKHVRERLRADGLAGVERLIQDKKPREALEALQGLQRQSGRLPAPLEARARELEVAAAADLRDLPRLLALRRRAPEALRNHEAASLLVIRALRAWRPPAGAAPPAAAEETEEAPREVTDEQTGERVKLAPRPVKGPGILAAQADGGGEETEAAEALRDFWKGRETLRGAWLCLDADALLSQGKREEALALLQGQTLAGKEDGGRLLRLAILNAGNPEQAVRWFEEAYKADPENPDLRSFRGQILEASGQDALARVEYTAALVAQPENPLMRDQLADFYLRQRNYAAATRVMEESLRAGALDFMRVKAEFWGRLARPLADRGPAKPDASGPLTALADFIAALPAGTFWDAAGFQNLPDTKVSPSRQREVFWLNLLQNLREGKAREREVYDALVSNPFRNQSPHVELETALGLILQYRLTGARPPAGVFGTSGSLRHQFFEALAAWNMENARPETEAFVSGPHAFAGACLAAGWAEAALGLTPEAAAGQTLEDAPEWFIYGLSQALRGNRGTAAALTFLKAQPPSVLLEMARGELELAEGRRAQAEPLLKKVAETDTDAGYRAAWLLAADAEERGDFDAARKHVADQPRLAGALTGRECLARLALREGRPEEARALYAEIAADSLEAKMFLAREAFAAKRWEEARRLTNELIARMPDALELRQNLAAIEEASSQP